MDKQTYIQDLKEIKSIMDRSSKFISLSGMSGVIAGTVALIGSYFAYTIVYYNQNYLSYRSAIITKGALLNLVLLGISLIVIAFLGGIYFTYRKAKKNQQKLWDAQAKRLLINLLIPLVAGGTLCLILLFKGFVGLVAPLTLIFYGLALINASKYTLNEIRSLGIVETILGLLACQYIGYGLIFWAIGFGVLHIVYGIYMHIKNGS